MATLKPQSNGILYSNAVIGTLAIDGWSVTFGTAMNGLGGTAAHPGPSSLYQCNSPLINDQYTTFILIDVAL